MQHPAAVESITVLLIEDQQPYTDKLKYLLMQARIVAFQMLSANSLSKGLRCLARYKIDVVLLDLELPDSHGLEPFNRVRNQFPHIPIVILTGPDDKETGIEAVRSGAQDQLAKDLVNPENLERILTHAVERYRLQSAKREYAQKLESSQAQLRRSLEAIRESESKWRAVFKGALNPFFLIDPDTKMILDVNEATCEVLHYSMEELIGRPFSTLFPPDADRSREELFKELKVHRGVFKSCDLLRSEGTICPMDLSVSLISWGENRVILVMLHDNTKHKRVMGKLVGRNNYFARIIEGMPAIVCGIRPDGKTTFINSAGEKITGYSSAELLGRNWWETFYPGDEYQQVEQLFRDMNQTDVRNYRMTLTTQNGEKRTIEWNSVNHYDANGQLIEIVGIGYDITEYKKTEEA